MIYTPLTNKAIKLIYKAHGGQTDKSGRPYVLHPIHLAEQMKDEYSTLVALLHDILEDTDTPAEYLREQFPAEVCDAVELLTKPEDMDYFDYIEKVKVNDLARRVKLCDLEHNCTLSRFDTAPDEYALARREKYLSARKILLSEAERSHSHRDGKNPDKPHPIKHFRTITRHRHKVISHCARAGIGWQGLFHDLSKYSHTEFSEGRRHYLGTRSPNERARELYGHSLAWMHHKGRNKHHYEYWTDVNPKSKQYEPVEMPLRYVTEMFCDRVAASKIYQGDKYTDRSALDYFLRGNAKNIMHPKTADLLESWLRMLADKGEKETFAHIKKLNRENRRKS